MCDQVYDLTKPAHDPNIPKPRGLLPVPVWIEEFIAQERAALPQYYTDEWAQRFRNYNTLRDWYEGHYIAWRETPAGVEVLAEGWDEISKLFHAMTAEQQSEIRTGPP